MGIVIVALVLAGGSSARAASGSAFLDPSQFASLGTFNPTNNVLVDMKSRQMSGGASFTGVFTTNGGTNVLVFTFTNFNLGAALSITFTNDGDGSRAVAFLSQSDMMVAGSIIAGGHSSGIGGPGGGNFHVGPGAGGAGKAYFTTGGGGGFGGQGGPGNGAESGVGGATYDPDLSAILSGGSGGGQGYYIDNGGNGLLSGGGGGGGVQVGASHTLTVSGSISADGAAGQDPTVYQSTLSAGAGGGSGGGILMQADKINVEAGASVSAQGGAGGAGTNSAGEFFGGGGGGGRILAAYRSSGMNSGSVDVAGGGSAGSVPGSDGQSGSYSMIQSDLVPILPSPGDAFLDPSQFASLGTFNPTTNVVIDARAGQMYGGASFAGVNTTQSGTNLLVFTFSSFNLNAGVTVTVTNDGSGSPAVAFLSQGDMTIAGSIIGDGHPGTSVYEDLGYETLIVATPGLGGPAGGNSNLGPGAGIAGSGAGGGGGGGYGGIGGNGSGGAGSGGLGGIGYNSDISTLLMGGSGGGDGGPVAVGFDNGGGLAGGGGGALQFGALAWFTISGTVSANGAAGGPGTPYTGGINVGGGGGGSGGGILIQAGRITIDPGAVVSAMGGLGGGGGSESGDGGGGGGGGGGRVYIGYHDYVTTNGSFNVSGGAGAYEMARNPPGTNGASGTVVVAQSSQVPAGLVLGATLTPGNDVLLSWPNSATNYLLETSATLGAGASWGAVTNTPAVVGNAFVITNPAGAGAAFFRLRSSP